MNYEPVAHPSTALAERTVTLEQALASIAHGYTPAAFASSLSIEDGVVTDAIQRIAPAIGIFTLDTGRMHGDTLALIETTERRYDMRLHVYRPAPVAVDAYVGLHGRDAFYASVELRKRCCELRKLEPLRRALAGKRAWITGLRREQSVTRATLAQREHDSVHGLMKFNPLADWSEDEVWAYIRAHDVPYNRLYDQGYRSIGCAPCTRPTVAGEDVRAGRWWWEQAESRECGLHVARDGTLRRTTELTR
jgi:phosphoadenosine phosphosulfate reductase